MKKNITMIAVITTVFSLLSIDAKADDYKIGDLELIHPWARASAGKAKAGVAYIQRIVNHGTSIDRLIGASTPAAKTAHLHTNVMAGGVMKMRPVKAIEINPGEAAVLKPGGFHIMLMGLHKPLNKGDSFPLTLVFEKAGKIELSIDVDEVAAMGGMDHGKTH